MEFLDKSRSGISRTHTTSSAPAPALAPATIAFTTTSTTIIDDILHSEAGNPNNLRYINARDHAALKVLAKEVLPSLTEKQKTLANYLADAQSEKLQVSEKVKSLWREKEASVKVLLEVFQDAEKPDDRLDADALAKRADFFKVARDGWESSLQGVLTRLNEEIIGPYALGTYKKISSTARPLLIYCPGDQFSIADLHLAGWTARLVRLAGGSISDDGNTAIERLERHIGGGFVLPKNFLAVDARRKDPQPVHQSKLAAFWDAVRERPSWKKIYANGLY